VSIYIVLCLIVGIGTGVLAARSGQLGWFIGGATARRRRRGQAQPAERVRPMPIPQTAPVALVLLAVVALAAWLAFRKW